MSPARVVIAIACTSALLAAALPAHAQQAPRIEQLAITQSGEDPAVAPAIALMREALTVHPDGRQNILLRSLRQLRDPQLTPLFRHIARSQHPALKVHGLLGLAESDPQQHLDLVEVAAIENPMMQAELLGAALDGELLGHEQAQQVLNWPGLDPGLKLLVAMLLVRDGKLNDPKAIATLNEGDNLAQISLTAALRLQLGDAEAGAQLTALNRNNTADRDRVRFMLMQAAYRNRLDKLGPWAVTVAREPGAPRELRLLGLRLGIRTGAPTACDVWREEYNASDDVAHRMRLALLALEMSPWCPAELYQPMVKDQNETISAMGRAGEAVASGKDVAPAMTELVDLQLPLLTAIAIAYAKQDASPEDARAILGAIIHGFKPEPRRNRSQRLDNAMVATRVLAERNPQMAMDVLMPLLSDPQLYEMHGEAILAGLVGAEHPELGVAVSQLPPLPHKSLDSIRIVLRAKHKLPLTAQESEQLGLIVRGGAGLPAAFRVQAAWLFLKQHHLADHALTQLIDQGVAGR